MKIVVLMWDFFGGGAERVAVVLANAFKALDHDVCIVVGRDAGPNRALVRADVPILVPTSNSPLAVLAHLRKVIAERRPDVVLSHQTTRNVIAILAHFSAPGRHSRIVVGVEHGEMSHTAVQTRGLGLKAFFQLARLAYPLASGIVAVSDNVAASVRRHVRPLPLRIASLPNPVVFPGFHERASQEPDHPFFRDRKGPVFVAVGRLEAQKNYSLLLDALAIVVRSVPARLIIFGSGQLLPSLEAQRTALGLQERVDFAGYVENPLPALRMANSLVLSSTWEGLPTVAIEALACGTPVVSTDNSEGIRRILDDGRLGWITPLGDAEAFAAAMLASLQSKRDPETLRNRSKAYEAEAVARQYLAHFDGLMRGGARFRRTDPAGSRS